MTCLSTYTIIMQHVHVVALASLALAAALWVLRRI